MMRPLRPTATRWWLLGVVALLATYLVLTVSASLDKGPSFDEGEQLAVGYDLWLHGDFRMEAANGDFVKRWATLPLLVTKPRLVTTSSEMWRAGAAYPFANEFLFRDGNAPDWLLLQGRVMIALLGVATGLVVFGCARELFGTAGGLVSLGIFVVSPNMLAFGAMVSTEMSLCLALLGSTWCVWRLLHRITWGRIAGSLAIFAMLVLSKPTAVLILPVVALMLAVRFIVNRPLQMALATPRVVTSRWAQGRIFGALIVLHALVGWGTIWAHYDFRYAASPQPGDSTIRTMARSHHDPISPTMVRAIDGARAGHWFPEGYLHGVEWLLGHDDERHAFMNGQWTIGGWRQFFLFSAWAKTPPARSLLLVVALGGWTVLARRRRRLGTGGRSPAPGVVYPGLYVAIPYLTILAVYIPAAVLQNLNIGHRHILPIYPVFYILSGAVALVWSAGGRWWRGVLVVAGLGLIADSMAVYPHYLAYFNPFVGGPRAGYRYLVDSSLDWGMDLPALRRWLDGHNPRRREPVFLAYFGTDSAEYRGIESRKLPSFFEWRQADHALLVPGLYVISATLLQTVYTGTFGPWNKDYEAKYQATLNNIIDFDHTAGNPAARAALVHKFSVEAWEREFSAFEILRFGRMCAWLRHHREPLDNIAYTMLVWRLTEADLQDIQFGPPAELAIGVRVLILADA